MKTKLMYLTSKVLVAVVLLLVLAAKAFSVEKTKLVVAPYAKELAVIAYTKPANSFAELSIEDEDGNMVFYSETSFETQVFSKLFSLKNLINGDYKVVLRSSEGEVVRFFEYENGQIVLADDEKTKYSSIESADDADLKITLLLSEEKDLEIHFSENAMSIQ